MTTGKQRWSTTPPASLRYERTFVYRADRPDVDPAHGYQYLDNFDIVVMRYGGKNADAIAFDQGADYARATAALPTMRVMPLEPSALWLRRNDVTARLLALWREGVDDWGLALLAAVYEARPLLWLLPAVGMYEEEHRRYRGYDLYACRDDNDWRASVWRDGAQLWMGVQNSALEAAAALDEARQWVDERGDR